MKAMPVTKAGVAAKPAAKKAAKRTAATAPAAKKSPAKKSVPAKKVVAEPRLAAKRPVSAGTGAKAARVLPDAAATIRRLTDSLRKMGKKRPTKPASLWRSLKSFLGADATEESVEVALARLIEDGVVKVDSAQGASYPRFGPESGSAVTLV